MMSCEIINVAVDGPAGAGKSTVSRAAAKAMGYIYVDTGALYRAVGVNALRNGIDTKDRQAVSESLSDISVNLVFENGEQKVLLNGEDVSAEIRTPDASMAASDVSAVPKVRDFLFDLQRSIASNNNCIMDGRDIGTVVLPNAKVKVFLTASPEERAMRRFRELSEKVSTVKYEEVLEDLIKRDEQDEKRQQAPLKPAKDAIILDNSSLDISSATAEAIRLADERIGKKLFG